jgi:hypothetical protein
MDRIGQRFRKYSREALSGAYNGVDPSGARPRDTEVMAWTLRRASKASQLFLSI